QAWRFLMTWLLILVCTGASFAAVAQEKDPKQEVKKDAKPDLSQKDDGKLPTEKDLEKKKAEAKAAPVKYSPVEIIVETSILAYGGRKGLEIARGAIQEEGTIRLASDQGDITGNYSMRGMRREKTWQDLLRVDLEMNPPGDADASKPKVKYIIGFNGASVWSAQNNQYITPTASAERAFRAQLTHEYMALLRYKEDG